VVNILDQYGKPLKLKQRENRIHASYDVAQYNDENRRRWEGVDSLSANAANDKDVRQILRDRSRYECANNSYAAGLIDELADAVIGTGPRLQLQIPGVPRAASREVERLYGYWCEQVNFAEKLRVAEKTKIRDGEVFGLEITNPALDAFLPQLDLKLYEAEQVSTPFLLPTDPRVIDGIIFDAYGNPETYHLLKYHPGSDFAYLSLEKEDIPAARMRHYFRPDRPGQARGIPEIMPALPLFALMRRDTLAVINNHEFAACISGVLYTDQAPEYQGSDGAEGEDPEFDRVEVEHAALLTLPKGYRAEGFESKQQFATYGMLKGELLNEMGRAVQVPGVIISGNYSQLNYSSGRLANLPYHRSIKVRRDACVKRVINPTFRSWLREAFLMGILPDGLPPIALWSWRWDFDGFKSVDPQKEALARQTLLVAGLTTYAAEFAEDGLDWEEQFEQRSIEQERMNDLGLSIAQALNVPMPQTTTTSTNENGEDVSETSQQAAAAGGVQGTALNGAQIASLMALADKVALKQYPPDAAESILQAAFPLMSKGLISKFVQSLSKYTQPPAPAAPVPSTNGQPAATAAEMRQSIAAIREDMNRHNEQTTERRAIANHLAAIEANAKLPLQVEMPPAPEAPPPSRRIVRLTRGDNGKAGVVEVDK
jgi:lambda family phage portal protein